ncbi:protein ENL isoform X2 [Colossoma macropomum]|uniref:protein ENL isoform X2 n=1 Tax=Colossoma macropomum TaxID=42526 RepID=UPI001864CCBD|nr:protein ENL isoform X2 [Colossoma macropomum]
MEDQCTVQVKLELGHRAQLRKKATSEGFTHDWMVFVRGPENSDIQHFVDKVIFRLHDSFPKPKRVCKEPPYKVEESGYAGFLMPIEVYFKNKEEPKKVLFNYDLFLNLEGNPPVNHLRCEKLTFNNPTRDFRRKLVKAGGIIVVPEGAEVVSRPSPDYPMLPTIPLSAFSDPKKSKGSQAPKELTKDNSGSTKAPKPHKLAKEHRERPRKDSESKASSKGDGERDGGGGGGGSSKSSRESSSFASSSSSSSKKPEIKVKEESKAPPKAAFKEPKLTLKESKMEGMSPKGGGPGAGGGGGASSDSKSASKRPSNADSPKPSVKKPKKGGTEGQKGSSGGGFPSTSPRVSSSTAPSGYGEKKSSKDKGRWVKGKPDAQEVKEPKKPPESDESNSDDEVSSKSEQSAPSSPSNSSSSSESSSDSDFEPQQKQGQGPLRSMVEDLQSEESDEDDSSSDEETPVKNNPPNRDSRLSLDSESDSSDGPHRPGRDPPPPPQKHASSNNKVPGRKSPDPCLRQEKALKKVYDKAYTEELVDLHRRLMALRERSVLQQIVNLIEETGHFNVTNTTFDFDLFSLDESTVRKLQSYLEATAT